MPSFDFSSFYAHTAESPRMWEPLYCAESEYDTLPESKRGHLNKVALLCAEFAGDMFPDEASSIQAHGVGYLLGLWHDLGKFSCEFQNYLKKNNADSHVGETTGRVDHSTAGAQYAAKECNDGFNGAFLASLIAAHHSGLDNAGHLFGERLFKPVCQWEPFAQSSGVLTKRQPFIVPFSKQAAEQAGADFCIPFLMRLFFSCLTDADALATESFCNPESAFLRRGKDMAKEGILAQMGASLDAYFKSKFGRPATPVNCAREGVRRDCLAAADEAPGFFSLNVPTGGGKTLASLAFALAHARRHGLRRIIYVIPYTSIIEQTAQTFREVFSSLSPSVVLEHHSQVDPERETQQSRMAAENWDAPLVVTTNVQFLESLFASRPSQCRKLHNIARSVVIFDEAQALPPGLLLPILKTLQCLVWQAHSSVVWCTATQPALEKREDFQIGIPREQVREIIKDVPALFHSLRRTHLFDAGRHRLDTLAEMIRTEGAKGALAIVNTTRAARELFQTLQQALDLPSSPVFHLSAKMCPVHREQILRQVRRRLERGEPTWLVATPLIEAGVDISFPVVFRELCGIDSLAQSAGRCNRNGELGMGEDAEGKVFLFKWERPYPMPLQIRRAAEVAHNEILKDNPIECCLSRENVGEYFRQLYWREKGGSGNQWDRAGIAAACARGAIKAIAFRDMAENFKIIESCAAPVILPWDESAQELIARVREISRRGGFPNRGLCRALQRYSVNVFPADYEKMKNKVENLCEGSFTTLISTDGCYDNSFGLLLSDEDMAISSYCI